jgi:putative glutathione S-transferase
MEISNFTKVLYINYGCPWASRANLVRTLKGLEDIIQIVVMDWELFPEGW